MKRATRADAALLVAAVLTGLTVLSAQLQGSTRVTWGTGALAVLTALLAGAERWLGGAGRDRPEASGDGGEGGPDDVDDDRPPLAPGLAPLVDDLRTAPALPDRQADVRRVLGLLARNHVVVVVGPRGVGASTVVLEAARAACAKAAPGRDRDPGRGDDRFPHGNAVLQLRVDGEPRPAKALLTELAAKLGLPRPGLGRRRDLPALARLVRQRIGARYVLIVLDGADDPDQVRPLLAAVGEPGRVLVAASPTCATGLRYSEAAVVHVEAPSHGQAVELLRQALTAAAPRPSSWDDDTLGDLVELCGRLPGPLRSLGRLAGEREWPLDQLIAWLRSFVLASEEREGAHEGRQEHTDPAAAEFAAAVVPLLAEGHTAYRALGPAAQRLFRLLPLAPGPLGITAMAALTGTSADETNRSIGELAASHLVQADDIAHRPRPETRPGPDAQPDIGAGGGYGVAEGMAVYAAVHLQRDEPAKGRRRAVSGLTRHLAAEAAWHVERLDVADDEAGDHMGRSYADGWFRAHRPQIEQVVLAPGADTGAARDSGASFDLAVGLCAWYERTDRLGEWRDFCERVRQAFAAHGDVVGWAANQIGVIERRAGGERLVAADAALDQAIHRLGRRGSAQARTNRALVRLDDGRLDEAVEEATVAGAHRSRADRRGQAHTRLALGAAQLARGAPEAHQALVEAGNAFNQLDDRRGRAAALTTRALSHWDRQPPEHADAISAASEAVELWRALGDEPGLAAALLNLAAARLATAYPTEAVARTAHAGAYDALAESIRIREGLPPTPGLARALLYLGDAARRLGDAGEASGHWAAAAALAAELGDEPTAGAARDRLANQGGAGGAGADAAAG
jgi:tetratricopeptide (TPR) repeat protein